MLGLEAQRGPWIINWALVKMGFGIQGLVTANRPAQFFTENKTKTQIRFQITNTFQKRNTKIR